MNLKKYHVLILIGAFLLVSSQVASSRMAIAGLKSITVHVYVEFAEPLVGSAEPVEGASVILENWNHITGGRQDLTRLTDAEGNTQATVWCWETSGVVRCQVVISYVPSGYSRSQQASGEAGTHVDLSFTGIPEETTTPSSVLTGDWYVADAKLIADNAQVTVTTPTILCRFIKTTTMIDDASVSCLVSVVLNGDEIYTDALTQPGDGVWEASFTLEEGTYNIALEATDGTSVVTRHLTLHILSDTIPTNGDVDNDTDTTTTDADTTTDTDETDSTLSNLLLFGGVSFVVVGSLVYVAERRRKVRW